VSDATIDERRRHQRHDTEFKMEGFADEGGVVARMVARNLSLGGLYCTSAKDFPEMTRLAVRLMLPTADEPEPAPVEVEAVVVRREKIAEASNGDPRYELALYFTGLEESTQARLQNYLAGA
jgi:hypothetical protein